MACFSCSLTALFLANCSAFVQTDILSNTQNYASPNPHIALSLQRAVLFREGLSLKNYGASYQQRAFELGRVLSLKTPRPLEY